MRFYYWTTFALCVANIAAAAVCVHSAYKCWRIADETIYNAQVIRGQNHDLPMVPEVFQQHREAAVKGYQYGLRKNAWAAPKE